MVNELLGWNFNFGFMKYGTWDLGYDISTKFVLVGDTWYSLIFGTNFVQA